MNALLQNMCDELRRRYSTLVDGNAIPGTTVGSWSNADLIVAFVDAVERAQSPALVASIPADGSIEPGAKS